MVELSTLEEAKMVHEDCLGEDSMKWTSSLTPTGGTKTPDGKIKITEESGKLKGTHENTKADLEDLECDGEKISFNRLEDQADGSKIRVFYEDGKITKGGMKVFINGKFRKVVEKAVVTDAAQQCSGATSVTSDILPDGDWEAEKPSA
jgi:hypothetical protein